MFQWKKSVSSNKTQFHLLYSNYYKKTTKKQPHRLKSATSSFSNLIPFKFSIGIKFKSSQECYCVRFSNKMIRIKLTSPPPPSIAIMRSGFRVDGPRMRVCRWQDGSPVLKARYRDRVCIHYPQLIPIPLAVWDSLTSVWKQRQKHFCLEYRLKAFCFVL